MVALHRYYHSGKDDHLYEVVADDIIVDLAVGELREDQYEYEGVECYVFEQSLEDEINTVNNNVIELNSINDHLADEQLPKNFKELPSDLDAILNGDNDENEQERDVKYLLIDSSGSSKKHGVYTIVTLIIMVGVICTIAYFYCYSKRHCDDIYEQETKPLLATKV